MIALLVCWLFAGSIPSICHCRILTSPIPLKTELWIRHRSVPPHMLRLSRSGAGGGVGLIFLLAYSSLQGVSCFSRFGALLLVGLSYLVQASVSALRWVSSPPPQVLVSEFRVRSLLLAALGWVSSLPLYWACACWVLVAPAPLKCGVFVAWASVPALGG